MAFDQEICDFSKKGTKAVHFTLLSPHSLKKLDEKMQIFVQLGIVV
jgi:hypothetical protein